MGSAADGWLELDTEAEERVDAIAPSVGNVNMVIWVPHWVERKPRTRESLAALESEVQKGS